MWGDLSAGEHLRLTVDVSARVAGRSALQQTVADLCSTVELPRKMLDDMPSQMRLLDRRRVELAMAAYNASTALLIDEIGAGLDIEETRSLYRIVADAVARRRVRAAIVVEHKLELLGTFASEIGLIEAGKITQRASCSEPARVAHLFDRMFDRRRPGVAKPPSQSRTLQ